MTAPLFRLFWILTLSLSVALAADGPEYDPLRKPEAVIPAPLDLQFRDEARGRELPLRVWLPASEKPAMVVLFSHGLGGNREAAAYLAGHWAARGYAVVCLQHPGSDDAIWKKSTDGRTMASLERAASGSNLLLRAGDVHATLNQLEKWNTQSGHILRDRLDTSRCGMSGHSFGALTTQLLAGQTILGRSFTDPRVKAAMALSPSPPRAGDAKTAFAAVAMPMLLMTGSLDDSPIGKITPEDRRKVFPALPTGDKYELVLDKARHNAFSDRRTVVEGGGRNPNHHRVIIALSTAFWDAYLRNDPQAMAWLGGEPPKAILEPDDQWRKK